MKCPDFFIIGAPKCGTTALYEYLSAHPQVFLPAAKEPHFFAADLPRLRDIETWDEYSSLFVGADSHHALVGEASVLYLFSFWAVRRILESNPNAKLIVMVRNPLEMLPALHNEYYFGFHEDQQAFADAWRLQDARANGMHLPPTCVEPKILQYASVGKLGEQMERLYRVASPQQVHVILFDDFAIQTSDCYRDVIRFLELPDDGRQHFPVINSNKVLRNRWLHRLLYYRRVPRVVRRVGRCFGLHRAVFWLKMQSVTHGRRPGLSEEMKSELRHTFAEDVALLSALLKRDLSGWLSAN